MRHHGTHSVASAPQSDLRALTDCEPTLTDCPLVLDQRHDRIGRMEPGPHNAITDVPGVLVGQVERVDAPYLTGTTVVYVPTTAVAGVDVRGGAPGTRETDLLSPVNSNGGVNAVVLTGGSAFGLDTAGSVMRWLEERGEGVRVGMGTHDVVPIVPTAVIFDLARGGDFRARPEPSWGADAISAATDGPVALGNHGAGA